MKTAVVPTEVLVGRPIGSFHEPSWDTTIYPEIIEWVSWISRYEQEAMTFVRLGVTCSPLIATLW